MCVLTRATFKLKAKKRKKKVTYRVCTRSSVRRRLGSNFCCCLSSREQSPVNWKWLREKSVSSKEEKEVFKI